MFPAKRLEVGSAATASSPRACSSAAAVSPSVLAKSASDDVSCCCAAMEASSSAAQRRFSCSTRCFSDSTRAAWRESARLDSSACTSWLRSSAAWLTAVSIACRHASTCSSAAATWALKRPGASYELRQRFLAPPSSPAGPVGTEGSSPGSAVPVKPVGPEIRAFSSRVRGPRLEACRLLANLLANARPIARAPGRFREMRSRNSVSRRSPSSCLWVEAFCCCSRASRFCEASLHPS